MKLSVIVPAYNEEANVRPLYDLLVPVLGRFSTAYEVLLIDDGSTDGTLRRSKLTPRHEGSAASGTQGFLCLSGAPKARLGSNPCLA